MQDRLNQILATRRALLQLLYRRSSFALALALHIAAVLFLFLGPVLFAEKRQNWEFVDVQIVPASALPQPAPRTRQQDPAEQVSQPAPQPPEPEPPKPETETPKPDPVPDRPQLPTEDPAEKPEKEPEPPKPQPSPPQVEPQPDPQTDTAPSGGSSSADPPGPDTDSRNSGTGPGGAPGPIAQLGPTAVLGFDDASFTYSYYVDRMLAAIAAQWVRPPVGRDIELVVHFVITSNGSVQNIEIIEPSGIRAFDRAGERAVTSASPLPPLPRSYRKDTLGVTLIIQ